MLVSVKDVPSNVRRELVNADTEIERLSSSKDEGSSVDRGDPMRFPERKLELEFGEAKVDVP